jgi:hypothetical protein
MAEFSITTAGSNVQLYQVVSLYANTNYVLSFNAYSNTGRDMKTDILLHVDPFTNYGLNEVVTLTASSQQFNIPFTTTGFTGTTSNARFRFWFADFDVAGDIYYIDNIELREVYGDGSCNGS